MKNRMRDLIDLLKNANEAYYAKNQEIMSDKQYDELYDELLALEKKSGIVYADSPTRQVGYQAVAFLPKEEHDRPMLSLDKTKSVEDLAAFTDQECLLSWKLDGLTVVLTYEDGRLTKAVTRGNGLVGEVVTNNARVFANLPDQIPFWGRLVLRGEAVIRYTDFERINADLPPEVQYKNPRNLCSGTVRQLNNEITAGRKVHFCAFTLVEAAGREFAKKSEELIFLQDNGFEVVFFKKVTPASIPETVAWFEREIAKNPYTTDGLVLTIDDILYSRGLGETSKFPRDSIAFKWQDEIRETPLVKVEWSVSRTGLINPIAVFEPVDLEGTVVRRASLHNISIVEELELGLGDVLTVYKANMIIPQVADNLTRSGGLPLPEVCPVCGQKAELREVNDIKTLLCVNPACPTKKLRGLEHFVSRNAMNIEGLSEATLEKFIQKGFLTDAADIFKLAEHKAEIIGLEGFGEKSYAKLAAAIEKARAPQLGNFIYALGIPNVGLSNAKLLARSFRNDLDIIMHAEAAQIEAVPGFGPVIAQSVQDYFADSENRRLLEKLQSRLHLPESNLAAEEETGNPFIQGKTFVITGSLEHYANRDELKDFIEQSGGKVTGSVSAKTDYLINNDISSASSKNKKAKELNIPIITEAEFREKSGQAD